MRVLIISLLLSSFTFFSCKSDKAATTNGASAPAAASPAPVAQSPQFESIDREIIAYLFQNCDYTDYIFYDLPFSMSQSTENSIKANLSYISSDVQATIPADCKPIARQMFHVKGDIVKEMDVYFGDNCAFYALMVNEKPIAANKMTEGGYAFYKQMIDQGMKQRQQINQGQQ